MACGRLSASSNWVLTQSFPAAHAILSPSLVTGPGTYDCRVSLDLTILRQAQISGAGNIVRDMHMTNENRVKKKMSDEQKREVLRDLDSDGTAVEVAEAMIAVDPSKETKLAADKLLKDADKETTESQEH